MNRFDDRTWTIVQNRWSPRGAWVSGLVAAALASCTEVPEPPPPVVPDTASVRVVSIVSGVATTDAFVLVKDKVPETFAELPTPGASGFRSFVVGEASAVALQGQATRGEGDTTLTKDAVYTVLASGHSADPVLTMTWVTEAFPAAVEGKAHVRFVRATDQGQDADVSVGGTVIASAPVRDSLGNWLEIAPVGEEGPPLVVGTEALLTARFSGLRAAAGELLTLVLVDGRAGSPPRLGVIRESRDVKVAATVDPLLEPDGVQKPKAFVRLLNASTEAGVVTAIAADQTTGPITFASALDGAQLGAWTEVVTDAQLTITNADGTLVDSTLALDEGAHVQLSLVNGGTPGTFVVVPWPTDVEATGHRARMGHLLSGVPGTLGILAESDQSVLLPAVASASTSDYVDVPADPVNGLLKLTFGANPIPPLARLSNLTFPDATPVTVTLVGKVDFRTPANSVFFALVIDDRASTVLQTIVPEALQTGP